MFSRLVNVRFQPHKVEEGIHIIEKEVVPVLKEQKGFKGQLFLTRPDSEKAVSINFWETEDDLVAFEAAPMYRELMGKLAGVLAGPPDGEQFIVSVQV